MEKIYRFIESLNAFFQGAYWVKNFALQGDKITIEAPAGYWRLEFNVYQGDILFLVIHVFVKTAGII